MKIPHHVAIVMDGNGRWARAKGLPHIAGHQQGVEVVRAIIKQAILRKIKVLSLFAFSSENWSRPSEEVDFLMQLFVESLSKEIAELHQNDIAIRFCGDRTPLSQPLLEVMERAEAMTANNQTLTLNVAMNYGGRWDIVTAAKKLVHAVNAEALDLNTLTESQFATFLDTKDLPAPDLFIRTSGEHRISNFFLWQLAYTELYFSDVFWPDFSPEAFDEALLAFAKRERRFGGRDPSKTGPSHV